MLSYLCAIDSAWFVFCPCKPAFDVVHTVLASSQQGVAQHGRWYGRPARAPIHVSFVCLLCCGRRIVRQCLEAVNIANTISIWHGLVEGRFQ